MSFFFSFSTLLRPSTSRHCIDDMDEEHDKGAGEPSTSAMEEEEGGEENTPAEEEGKEEGRTEEEGRVGGTTTAMAARDRQAEIDNVLEETARRKNLSVINVKSILRVSVMSMKLLD